MLVILNEDSEILAAVSEPSLESSRLSFKHIHIRRQEGMLIPESLTYI